MLRILLRAVNLFSFSHIVSSDSSFNIHNALYFAKYPSRAEQNSPEGRRRPTGRGLKIPGLKHPDICLTGEENPPKSLTQETCPNRGSNPSPQPDRRACYRLLLSGGPGMLVRNKTIFRIYICMWDRGYYVGSKKTCTHISCTCIHLLPKQVIFLKLM